MEIASAFVTVAPSMKGFRRQVTSEVESSGDTASRSFTRRFGSRLAADGRRMGVAFGKALAAGAAITVGAGLAFAKGAIDEAANLEQSVGAIESVFKRSSGQMLKWSKNAAKAVGLSKNEFNELGTLIGAQLKNGGTAMDQLAPKTNQLIKLGADLSSMFGGNTREAVEALSSALKGERDPIERYGVTLNQAKIDAEAAALGFTKVGNSFDTQAQQAATLSLIYKQTKDAQGNFNRETDTTAHKQQVLGARFANLKARIGKGLLPVYNQLLDILEKKVGPVTQKVIAGLVGLFDLIVKGDYSKNLRKAFGWAEDSKIVDAILDIRDAIGKALGPVIEKFTKFMRKNPAVVKAFAITLGILAAAIGVVTLATTAFSIALNSTGIPLVIIGIAALVAGLVYAYQHSERFREIVDRVGQALRSFAGWVRDEVIPIVVDLARKVATNLQPVWTALVEFFQTSVLPTAQKVIAKFQEWQPTIQKVAGFVLGLVAAWFNFVTMLAGKVLPIVIKVAGWLLRNFWPALAGGVSVIGTIIGKLVAFGTKVTEAGQKVGDFARKVGDKIGKVITWFSNLPGKVAEALSTLAGDLLQVGVDAIAGLAQGIKDGVKKYNPLGLIKGVGTNITEGFKEKLDSHSPSLVFKRIGRDVILGFAIGVTGSANLAAKAMDKMYATIDKVVKKNDLGKKVSKQAKAIVASVGKAADALRTAIAQRNELAGSVASNLMGEFNLSEITAKNEFGLSQGPAAAVKIAQSIVARMRAFGAKLVALVRAGMPAPLVNEIAGYGSIEGSRVADVFLQASKAQMTSLKTSYAQFQAATAAAGLTVANATYGGDISKAERNLEKAIERGLSKMGLKVDVGIGKNSAIKIYKIGKNESEKRN
ncbi:phage tail protein [Pimelobacter simplex]|uniref:phage tail protein n=1 Tax=Nocardioides simplex TaxID=2045 RepID=UPI003AAB6058